MTDNWIAEGDFPPTRNAPCFCGSGERFKRCCGRGGQGVAPQDLHIVPDFIGGQDLEDLAALGETCPGERLKVMDLEASTPEKTIRKFDDRRVTERVNLGDADALLEKLVRRAYSEVIIPTLGQELAWFERPQMLRYQPGGCYQRHADSNNYYPERNAWRKDLDRDISLLIYLNQAYTGGDLTFSVLDYVLQPKAGMLAWFPSDHRFQHL